METKVWKKEQLKIFHVSVVLWSGADSTLVKQSILGIPGPGYVVDECDDQVPRSQLNIFKYLKYTCM